MRASWTPNDERKWRDFIDHAVDFLEDNCGVREKVRVWRTEYARQFGWTNLVRGEFIVKVARRLDYSDAVWTLIHELAHVASWRLDHSQTGHGPMWGLAESAMVRLYEGWE